MIGSVKLLTILALDETNTDIEMKDGNDGTTEVDSGHARVMKYWNVLQSTIYKTIGGRKKMVGCFWCLAEGKCPNCA